MIRRPPRSPLFPTTTLFGSAEVNGKPRLMCMTRLSDLDLSQKVTVEPIRAFPPVRDLVTDVSWNFRVKKQIKPRSEEHTSELQSRQYLVCRLLLEKKKTNAS